MLNNLPEHEKIVLYEFAVKYAKVCRAYCVEVDEAVNEMVLALDRARWHSREYAKEVMRNRLHQLIRREKTHESLTDKYPWPSSREDTDESLRWDARLEVADLLTRVPTEQAKTINLLLSGYTVEEISRREGLNRSTVHRHIAAARVLLTR